MGLLTDGNAAVESSGDVINVLSRTGRMGSAVPVDASREGALLNKVDCASRMSSNDSASQQAVSEAPQEISPLKELCKVSCVVVERKPKF